MISLIANFIKTWLIWEKNHFTANALIFMLLAARGTWFAWLEKGERLSIFDTLFGWVYAPFKTFKSKFSEFFVGVTRWEPHPRGV